MLYLGTPSLGAIVRHSRPSLSYLRQHTGFLTYVADLHIIQSTKHVDLTLWPSELHGPIHFFLSGVDSIQDELTQP